MDLTKVSCGVLKRLCMLPLRCSRDPYLCDKLRFIKCLCVIYRVLLKRKQNTVLIHVYSSIYTNSSSLLYSCAWCLGWSSIRCCQKSFDTLFPHNSLLKRLTCTLSLCLTVKSLCINCLFSPPSP